MFLVVLPVLELALIGYILFFHFPQSTTSLPLMVRFEPGTGLLYLWLFVFTIGWGILRTIMAIRKFMGTGRVPQPAA